MDPGALMALGRMRSAIDPTARSMFQALQQSAPSQFIQQRTEEMQQLRQDPNVLQGPGALGLIDPDLSPLMAGKDLAQIMFHGAPHRFERFFGRIRRGAPSMRALDARLGTHFSIDPAIASNFAEGLASPTSDTRHLFRAIRDDPQFSPPRDFAPNIQMRDIPEDKLASVWQPPMQSGSTGGPLADYHAVNAEVLNRLIDADPEVVQTFGARFGFDQAAQAGDAIQGFSSSPIDRAHLVEDLVQYWDDTVMPGIQRLHVALRSLPSSEHPAVTAAVYERLARANPTGVALTVPQINSLVRAERLLGPAAVAERPRQALLVEWSMTGGSSEMAAHSHTTDQLVLAIENVYRDEGFEGLRYINTASDEIAGAADPTSAIVFNPNPEVNPAVREPFAEEGTLVNELLELLNLQDAPRR